MFLIAIKLAILFLMLRNFKEEIDQIRGIGIFKYCEMIENVFDLGQIVCYIICLVLDMGPVASDLCIMMYQPTLLFMFLVLIRHLKLDSSLSFILEMLVMTLGELQYFLWTYALLLVLFTALYYTQTMSIADEYTDVWIFGPFLMTIQESLGNFGTVNIYVPDTPGFSDIILILEYNFLWTCMVFILMIIYTNFLIASVSDTYEKVTDVQEATFTKTQLEYLTMMMEINE